MGRSVSLQKVGLDFNVKCNVNSLESIVREMAEEKHFKFGGFVFSDFLIN